MEESQRRRLASVFGDVAEAYARSRPGYPDEAVRWMTGPTPGTVLELGAGTGQLTTSLLALGHRVVAVEPASPMLRPLRKHAKGARVVQASAEQIPIDASSVDAVVVGQAFHWFDVEPALREIARVLRPGGTFALAWNLYDVSVPWVRRLTRLIEAAEPDDPTELLEESELFDGVEHESFRHWQQVFRDSLIELVESRSWVAAMSETERGALLDKVADLYDEYGRGHDGMLLPYNCRAYRCRVSGVANYRREQAAPLDDGLLIDFS